MEKEEKEFKSDMISSLDSAFKFIEQASKTKRGIYILTSNWIKELRAKYL